MTPTPTPATREGCERWEGNRRESGVERCTTASHDQSGREPGQTYNTARLEEADGASHAGQRGHCECWVLRHGCVGVNLRWFTIVVRDCVWDNNALDGLCWLAFLSAQCYLQHQCRRSRLHLVSAVLPGLVSGWPGCGVRLRWGAEGLHDGRPRGLLCLPRGARRLLPRAACLACLGPSRASGAAPASQPGSPRQAARRPPSPASAETRLAPS